jgi:hypothetical protein
MTFKRARKRERDILYMEVTLQAAAISFASSTSTLENTT